jgi:hypothetical protein
LQVAERDAASAAKHARVEADGRCRELRKEQDVLSELNRSLIANQKDWKDKVTKLECESREKDATITVRLRPT